MDIAKVRELTDNELNEELAKQRRHLYDLRFQLATRQLTDYAQLTQTRRTIARILTVQTEREATDGRPQPRPAADAQATPRRRLGVRRRSEAGEAAPAAESDIGPERASQADDSAETAAESTDKKETSVATAEPSGRTRGGRGTSR